MNKKEKGFLNTGLGGRLRGRVAAVLCVRQSASQIMPHAVASARLLQIAALISVLFLMLPGCAEQSSPARKASLPLTVEDVVRREAKAHGIALTAQEEADAVKRLQADVAEYALDGSADSLDLKKMREDYLFSALSDKLCAAVTGNVTVEEAKVREWYDARYAALKTAFDNDPGLYKNQQEGYERYGGVPPLFVPEGYIRFRHILIADEATANAVLMLLREGAPFGELLVKFGMDAGMKIEPYQSHGYLTSEYASNPDYISELKEAALALKDTGDVSEIVKSSAGFHIIELTERIPAGDVSYEAARNAIQKLLETQARREAYEAMIAGWMVK